MNGQSKPNAHRSNVCRRALVAVAAGGCLAGFALSWGVGCVRADDEDPRYFENNIRPILAERCSRCHGAKKQSSGLRLDSRQS
ncbi:MAG: hypothetical protein VB835_12365, partial [Pirellulales bacterium]